jgi:hypothetical protein
MYVHLFPVYAYTTPLPNSPQLFINNNKSLEKDSRKITLLFIADFWIKKKKRQRSTFLYETRRPKLANASIDEKLICIKFIEFLKIKYVNYGNKISIHLYFLLDVY